MPLELILVTLVAACIAGQLNRGIDRLAWNQRALSPWGPSPPQASSRSWLDRLPVVGWWRLRREAALHGPGFWVRPALIEAGFILGLPTLYWFELSGGLLPIGAGPLPPEPLRAMFMNHACLIALMVVATFIDLDEKTIPDEITISGTLLAVLLAGFWPQVALPAWTPAPPPIPVTPLRLTTPAPWSPALDGRTGWVVANLCILGWWYALLPKTLWYRSGVRRFFQLLVASLVRHRFAPRFSALALLALVGTGIVWGQGGANWRAVLSAWLGMAIGGAMVWLVRIVGSLALGQEAMGFGDVTLMGMIGAFLGWQPALLVFFLAPFTGVLIAVSQWLLTGRKDIAYGPFLCLAALLVIVGWAGIWQGWGFPLFALGWVVPLILLCSLLLLGGLLWALQRLKAVLGYGG